MAKLSVGSPRVILRVPSSQSSRTRRGIAQEEIPLTRVPYSRCRRHHHHKPGEMECSRNDGGTLAVLLASSTPSSRTGNARRDTRAILLADQGLLDGARDLNAIIAPLAWGWIHGQGNRGSCRRLKVVAERTRRQRDKRSNAPPLNLQEAGGVAVRCAGRAMSDLATPWGRVRHDLRLQKPDPFSDVIRKGSTSSTPSGFRGDLHSYVAHRQQSFKKARDAREAPLQHYEQAWRVRERRNIEVDRTDTGTRMEVTNPVPVLVSTVELEAMREIAE